MQFRAVLRVLTGKNGIKTKLSKMFESREKAEMAALKFRIEMDFGKKFFQRKDTPVRSATQMAEVCSVVIKAVDPEVLSKRTSLLKSLRDGQLPALAKYLSEPTKHANNDHSYSLAELRQVHEQFTMVNGSKAFWRNTEKPILSYHHEYKKFNFKVTQDMAPSRYHLILKNKLLLVHFILGSPVNCPVLQLASHLFCLFMAWLTLCVS